MVESPVTRRPSAEALNTNVRGPGQNASAKRIASLGIDSTSGAELAARIRTVLDGGAAS